MEGLFNKDFFSNNVPSWTESLEMGLLASFLRNSLADSFDFTDVRIEHSEAFGINSSNFRVGLSGQEVLLKRWSIKSDQISVQKIVERMEFISNAGLPVPKPLKFKNGSYIVVWDGYLWSYFPFINGDYYSGSLVELTNAAIATGQLTDMLSSLPFQIYPEHGPQHLTDTDNLLIKRMNTERGSWCRIFGEDNACFLEEKWDELVSDWNRLRSIRLSTGVAAPVHFDLHPHNLIVDNSKVVGILDFESCKAMPIGYALAFSALKQCRQAIVYSGGSEPPELIGRNYVKILSDVIKEVEPCIPYFSDLALAEVFRRLCVIFKLNLEENNNMWNAVLPIQLNHVSESKMLFKLLS